MSSTDIFTFITVYYKYGEYGFDEFKTLREGLQQFLEDYTRGNNHEDGIHRQQLEALPDEELLTELLELGSEQIEKQRGHGLVAVVRGPRVQTQSCPCVYLEVYYKYGEYNIAVGWSSYLNDAMAKLEYEMEKDGNLAEWEDMSDDEQEDLALERCREDVEAQRGWGAVLVVPGWLVAKASM